MTAPADPRLPRIFGLGPATAIGASTPRSPVGLRRKERVRNEKGVPQGCLNDVHGLRGKDLLSCQIRGRSEVPPLNILNHNWHLYRVVCFRGQDQEVTWKNQVKELMSYEYGRFLSSGLGRNLPPGDPDMKVLV